MLHWENLNSTFYVEHRSISVQIPHWSFHYSEKFPSKKVQHNTNFVIQEIVIKRISMILFSVLSNVGAAKWQTFSTVFSFSTDQCAQLKTEAKSPKLKYSKHSKGKLLNLVHSLTSYCFTFPLSYLVIHFKVLLSLSLVYNTCHPLKWSFSMLCWLNTLTKYFQVISNKMKRKYKRLIQKRTIIVRHWGCLQSVHSKAQTV